MGRSTRVLRRGAGDDARTPREQAPEAGLRAHLSRRALPMLINLAPAARHVGAGSGRSCSISPRISANSVLGTATSASWKVT